MYVVHLSGSNVMMPGSTMDTEGYVVPGSLPGSAGLCAPRGISKNCCGDACGEGRSLRRALV